MYFFSPTTSACHTESLPCLQLVMNEWRKGPNERTNRRTGRTGRMNRLPETFICPVLNENQNRYLSDENHIEKTRKNLLSVSWMYFSCTTSACPHRNFPPCLKLVMNDVMNDWMNLLCFLKLARGCLKPNMWTCAPQRGTHISKGNLPSPDSSLRWPKWRPCDLLCFLK